MTAASINAGAQAPQKVYDIYPGILGSDPMYTTVYNGKLYFAAEEDTNGRELWVYDGVDTPSLVDDIVPGTTGSIPVAYNRKWAVLNGKLYFSANIDPYGTELMVYDGVNPPAMAAEIYPGANSSSPRDFVVIGDSMYFSATTSVNGNELFTYDGTGQPVLHEINLGAGSSTPQWFTELNGKVYFSASNGTSGAELFVYDRATSNIGLVADIEAGSGSSTPTKMVRLDNKLYFTASTANYGTELYSYDGTAAMRVTDVATGAVSGAYGMPVAYNGMIYFNGSTNGLEYQLYRYDPSNGAASLVHTINTMGSAGIANFTLYANKLYFRATNGFQGSELWSHDGTTTAMVFDLSPGPGSSDISDLAVFNNKLYFNGTTGGVDYELYSFDITTGIQSIKLNGSVLVMPNPTTGDATLQLSLQSPHTLSVQVTDVTGRLIWQSAMTAYHTGNSNINLPVAAQSTGIYFYRVMDNKGIVLAAGKLQKL